MLKDQDIEEQRLVGAQALSRALKLFNRSINDLSDADWLDLLQWRHIDNKMHYLSKLQLEIYFLNL